MTKHGRVAAIPYADAFWSAASMIRFPAVDCALEGFRLTRERPRVVAVWGLLLLVSAVATSAIAVGSGLQPALLALQAASRSGDQVLITARLAAVGARGPALVLVLLIGLLTNVVIYTALLRAVLRPEAASKTFFLRVGVDEARQLGVSVLIAGLLLVALSLMTIVATLLVAVVPGAAGSAAALTMSLVVAALMFPVVRLTLVAATTFDLRRIAFREAWTATRGQFGAMLGTYVLAIVMAVLVYLLVMIVIGALLLAGLEIAGLGLRDLGAWMQLDTTSLAAMFSPQSLVALLFQGVITTLVYVVTMSPAPAICRALRGTTATA